VDTLIKLAFWKAVIFCNACISVVANIDWIIFYEYGSNAFWDHCQIFEATFEFLFPTLLLVHVVHENDERDYIINQLVLGMIRFEPCHLKIIMLCFHLVLKWRIQLLSFVYSGFNVLFVDYAMMFVALKSRKQCCPIGLLFQDNTGVLAYFSIQ
jgi:hypothetical protein